MSDLTFEDFMERALREFRSAKSEADLERRLAALEERAQASSEIDDATIDRIVDRLEARFKDERSDDDPEPDDDPDADDDPEPDDDPDADDDPEPEPDRPRGRLNQLRVPKIWQGEDEPDLVEYIDAETGKVAVRAGRKKGAPAAYDFEPDEEEAA